MLGPGVQAKFQVQVTESKSKRRPRRSGERGTTESGTGPDSRPSVAHTCVPDAIELRCQLDLPAYMGEDEESLNKNE